MSADLGKDFAQFQQKVEAVLKTLPIIAAHEAQNFFLDSWKKQAWIGDTTEPWKKRKRETRRSRGKAILVGEGKLRRFMAQPSAIKQATWDRVIIQNDSEYASVHNDSYRGTYTRTPSRITKVKGSYRKLGDEAKTRGTKISIRGAEHLVHQNIPRRRFMGNSPYLNQRMDRTFIQQLTKLKQ